MPGVGYKLARLIQELGPISRDKLWRTIELYEKDLIKSRSHSKLCLRWLEVNKKINVGVYRPLPGEEFLLSNPQADKTTLNQVIEAWTKKDPSKHHPTKDALFVYNVNLNSFLPPLAFRPEQLKEQREKRKQQIAEHKSQLSTAKNDFEAQRLRRELEDLEAHFHRIEARQIITSLLCEKYGLAGSSSSPSSPSSSATSSTSSTTTTESTL